MIPHVIQGANQVSTGSRDVDTMVDTPAPPTRNNDPLSFVDYIAKRSRANSPSNNLPTTLFTKPLARAHMCDPSAHWMLKVNVRPLSLGGESARLTTWSFCSPVPRRLPSHSPPCRMVHAVQRHVLAPLTLRGVRCVQGHF